MTRVALEEKLGRAKKSLLSVLNKKGADFDFHIVSDKEMEKVRAVLLKREDFKGKEARKIQAEETINVLAFTEPKDFPHPESGKKLLGEIYLNYNFKGEHPAIPVPKGLRKGSIEERYATLGPLFIHGLLHLLGYLHWTKRDTIKMQNLEKKLWEEIILL